MKQAIIATIAFMLSSTTALRAQQPGSPHSGYIFPAGGQRGTTVQVEVGGQFLNGVREAYVSGRGVSARVMGYDRPLPPQRLAQLRDTAQALQRQLQTSGNRDPAIRQRLLELRATIANSLQRSANPVLSETVRLELTIDADAEPGTRRLRLSTPLGLTEPLAFVVGQLPEFRESDYALAITLPAVVNGQLIPGGLERNRAAVRNPQLYRSGDVDRYRFYARQGQQLLAIVSARELMPYLADAVPGWVQATLELFDARGKELAAVDDYRFQPDPVLHYEIPADGEYVIEIHDALYRGREDFVYRIAIGELPFVASFFPLGGRTGDKTTVALSGWNLPNHTVEVNGKGKPPGVHAVSIPDPRLPTVLPFALDDLPEVLEREPNDAKAQVVMLPRIVNGRIDQPGDNDLFSFTGKAGDTIVAEVNARRLSTPLDASLELLDTAGQRIAWNDDHDDPCAGLETHHADPYIMTTLPSSGLYTLRIADIQRKGGVEYAYRLRISAPRPDFELRVSPTALSASTGSTVPVTITAIREDGFSGDITLALENAPRPLVLTGATIPRGQDQVRMTITVPPDTRWGVRRSQQSNIVPLTFVGRASIGRRTIVRRAVPAEEMMQAFAYRHLVPAEQLWLVTRGRGATAVPARILVEQPVRIPWGGVARVLVSLPPGYLTFEKLQFQLSKAPPGITLRDVSLNGSSATLTLQADTIGSRAGPRDNLIVEVTGERAAGNAQEPQRARRVVLGYLPAIAFELIR